MQKKVSIQLRLDPDMLSSFVMLLELKMLLIEKKNICIAEDLQDKAC